MLEISDTIEIKNESVIYNQLSNGEQLNLESDLQLHQVIYDTTVDKNTNHTLILDKSQTDQELVGNTKWIMDIEVRNILRNYIFANMKKYRTFEGVLNSMTINNNVDSSVYEYIDKNVLSRYKFLRVELFIKSVNLLTTGGLRLKNTYDPTIENESTKFLKFQTETDANEFDIRLFFSQPESSSIRNFKYYYNLYFEKL